MELKEIKKDLVDHVYVLSQMFGIENGPAVLEEYFKDLMKNNVINNYSCHRSVEHDRRYEYTIMFDILLIIPNSVLVVTFPPSPNPMAKVLYD